MDNICSNVWLFYSSFRFFINIFTICLLINWSNCVNYKIENIEKIEKSGQNLTSISLQPGQSYVRVKEVNVQHNKLEYEDVIKLINLTMLEHLYMYDNNITGAFDLGVLVDLKYFTIFNAPKNKITELKNSQKGKLNSIQLLSFAENDLICHVSLITIN